MIQQMIMIIGIIIIIRIINFLLINKLINRIKEEEDNMEEEWIKIKETIEIIIQKENTTEIKIKAKMNDVVLV